MARELRMVEVVLTCGAHSSDTPAGQVQGYINAMLKMAYTDGLAKPTSLFATQWRELRPE